MKFMQRVPVLAGWIACVVLMSALPVVRATPVRASWDIEFGSPDGWAGTFTVSNDASLAQPDGLIDTSIRINTPYGEFSSTGGDVGAGATEGRCSSMAHEVGIDEPPYPWGVCTPNILWGSLSRPSDGLSLNVSPFGFELVVDGKWPPVAYHGYSIHRRSPDLATFTLHLGTGWAAWFQVDVGAPNFASEFNGTQLFSLWIGGPDDVWSFTHPNLFTGAFETNDCDASQGECWPQKFWGTGLTGMNGHVLSFDGPGHFVVYENDSPNASIVTGGAYSIGAQVSEPATGLLVLPALPWLLRRRRAASAVQSRPTVRAS